jgi:hypothetical protein
VNIFSNIYVKQSMSGQFFFLPRVREMSKKSQFGDLFISGFGRRFWTTLPYSFVNNGSSRSAEDFTFTMLKSSSRNSQF